MSLQAFFEYPMRIGHCAPQPSSPTRTNPAHSELQSMLIEHITLALSDVETPAPDIDPRQIATFIIGWAMTLVGSWLKQGNHPPISRVR